MHVHDAHPVVGHVCAVQGFWAFGMEQQGEEDGALAPTPDQGDQTCTYLRMHADIGCVHARAYSLTWHNANVALGIMRTSYSECWLHAVCRRMVRR